VGKPVLREAKELPRASASFLALTVIKCDTVLLVFLPEALQRSYSPPQALRVMEEIEIG
jgi:hypothetical protein